VFGAQARNCAQCLNKGSRVFVDAELDWREWTDQQNNKREAVTLKARQVVFEGGRAEPAPNANSAPQAAASAQAPQPAAVAAPVPVTAGSAADTATVEDLPF
jgi:single-stranded DNA-binding protein